MNNFRRHNNLEYRSSYHNLFRDFFVKFCSPLDCNVRTSLDTSECSNNDLQIT
jgi:hypothetical protein